MLETLKKCFGLKICSTTFRQAKTGKHECRNITEAQVALLLYFSTRAYLFSPNERYVAVIFRDVGT